MAGETMDVVCYMDELTLEEQQLEVTRILTSILGAVHKSVEDCATSILNRDYENKRELELTSNIYGLIEALK